MAAAACGGGETEEATGSPSEEAGGSASGGKAGSSAAGGKAGASGSQGGSAGKAGSVSQGGSGGKAGGAGGGAGGGAAGAGASGSGGKAGSAGVGGNGGSSGKGGASGSGVAGSSGAGASGASGQSGASGAGQAGSSGASGAGGASGGAGTGGMAGSGGLAGSGGMAGSGGGAGGGAQCQTEAQCPAAENPCVVATCEGGVCGKAFVAAGQPTATQKAGDCSVTQCDGSGNVTTLVDDNDLPDDGNDCTQNVCSGGVASNPATTAGTPCGASGGLACNGQGACVGCLTAADCAGQDTACATRTCTAGVCGVSFAASGTPAGDPTAGDCQHDECDGKGGLVSAPFNQDLPSDTNACTEDVCQAGTPAHTPVAPGTSCNQNGGSVCDDKGACVECVTASTCPGQDTECQTRTCDAGKCGVSFAPAGTALSAQTSGDCKTVTCDGAGKSVAVADDADLPLDSNPCTEDVCTAGVASNPPVGQGASCGQNGLCNAQGQCVGCIAPTDCPGVDDECQARTCTAGVCGFAFAQAGKLVASQTAGDCKKNQCDGAGKVAQVNDDADVPVDQNECTQDVCSQGVASNPPAAVGNTCSAGFCNAAGQCVGCLSPSTCPGQDTECQTRTCAAGKCGVSFAPTGTTVASQTAGDCKKNVCDGAGSVAQVADGSDVPVDNNQCTADVCTSGTPSNPPLSAGASCSQNNGAVCSGAGTCVQCITASTCPGQDTECQARTCTAGVCGLSFQPSGTAVSQQNAGDCKKNVCNGSGAVVAQTDAADLPVDGNACTQDVCTGSAPSNPPLPSGTSCGNNSFCNGSGQCVGCVTASTCPGQDTECQARTCTAGVCGFNFQPAGTPVASQMAGDCKKNVCDGSGNVAVLADPADVPVDNNQCTGDVCSAGNPSNPPLPSGTSCSQNGGSVCSGSGACVQCVTASTCPGQDTECQTRTCSAGMCGVSFAPAGTLLSGQTPFDCKSNVCDGAGNPTVAPDASDLPNDSNQCTADVCTNGAPSNPPVPVGTACNQNGGSACDSAGACSAQPTVTATTPANGATATASTTVSVTFSQAMNPATVTAQSAAGACSGSIQVSLDDFATCVALGSVTMSAGNTQATVKPAPGLLVNRTYKIRVTTAAQSQKGLALAQAFTQAAGFKTQSPNLCDGSLVISQVYGGGGLSSATYKNDFVELHNRGTTPVDVSTMSIQYASTSGTSWSKVALTGSVPAGGYYLVQLASGGSIGAALPAFDAMGSIDMASANGKVALVSDQVTLSGSCPGATALDFVGYGTANCAEGGTAAPALSSSLSAQRVQGGCGDLDQNNNDFEAKTPVARNSATVAAVCSCVAQNESGAAAEADYCDTQFPLTLTLNAGAASGMVYGRVYESGVTEAAGASTAVRAQLGYGPASANPEYEAGWKWANASFNVQAGNNDEYQAAFTAPAAGSYRYAYRVSVDQGVSWTYCDNNQGDTGSGSNPGLTFDFADLGVMTVNP